MSVTENSTSTYEELSTELRIFHSVSSIAIAIAGTVGNIISIYRLTRKSQRQQTCNIYLVNLSVNNLLSSGIILPLIAVNSFFNGWIYGLVFCKLFGYVLYTNICVEGNAITLLTFNRFLKIVHPNTYNTVYGRPRNNAIIIAVSWLFYAVLLIFPVTDIMGEFGYDPNKKYCGMSKKDNFALIIAACFLLTSVPLICYSYVSIFLTFKKSKQKIADKKTDITSTEQTNTGINSRQEMRLLRMIIMIMVCFLLTYTPYSVITVVDPRMELAGRLINTIIIYICWSHLFINPIIYILKNPQK
ncbi:G-protein coupled receptor moody-like [Haliotis rufescens]|uniref:G-protein coupled receptor moody-like n=1 Tax=Haliotis rufescens TaxID=6454 RepID=UPI001EB08ABF|nr:G-protein coupled receptor moody-like [Haliotis rufescens]